MEEITLRDVEKSDLDIFFEQQVDEAANYMAAFTRKEPQDRDAFLNHWIRITADKKIIIKTIIYEGKVAGSVLRFEQFGEPEVSYWIGKEYWGKGIATGGLLKFLELVNERPLFARAAADNIASIRVLEKCGFKFSRKDKGYANARGEEIEEVIYLLK